MPLGGTAGEGGEGGWPRAGGRLVLGRDAVCSVMHCGEARAQVESRPLRWPNGTSAGTQRGPRAGGRWDRLAQSKLLCALDHPGLVLGPGEALRVEGALAPL